jgi:hypothetical protein
MQITLTIPDAKADSFFDVLRQVPYAKVHPSDTSYQPSASDEEDHYQSAEEFYEGLKRSINELNEILAGRKQGCPVEELIAELRSSDPE